VTGVVSGGMRIYIGEVAGRPARGVCRVTHARARLRRGASVVSYRERPWFNFEEASLTPSEADRALTDFSGSPLHERTIYLAFSLRPEERERLGMPEEQLYEAMVEATRSAMRVFAREVGAEELLWVASARADYPQPCVKVLINRWIGVTRRGLSRFQKMLPRRLRPHLMKREGEDEPRRVTPGLCGEAFLEVLDTAAGDRSEALIERCKK
jgi:hypothetical protein